MNKYIPSLRLRTLPLSMSGIILGTGLARPNIDWFVFVWAILTTLSLQILSNLSNELGDAQRGTDAEQQGRAAYGLQTGALTEKEMKRMIVLFIFLNIVFGSALVLTAFDTFFCWKSAVFLGLGALAIVAAMTYTLGKHNYGYKGFGDLGVFLFFGLLSTMGGYYLQTQTITTEVVLAAVAIGLPIVGVLNLNNIRDMDNDLQHGKRTFASLLGKTGGKIYHICLLTVCFALFVWLQKYWVLCALPVIVWHVIYIFRHEGHELDLQMPVLIFTTIAIAALAII